MTRRFQLRRNFDPSGVSVTGVIVEGVQFTAGHVAIAWLKAPEGFGVAIYSSTSYLMAIHGDDGDTRLEWQDCQDCGRDVSGGHLECHICAGVPFRSLPG